MRKRILVAAGIVTVCTIATGVGVSAASSGEPARPAWVTADNRLDLAKMPDNAKVPHHCWNGKTVELDGKTFKQRATPPVPGSRAHELALAKSKELHSLQGVTGSNENGGQQLTLDDKNPQVQAVMQKYESQETPQCR
jgi:hypothetical protein